jgi:hypothetical protein
MAAALSSYWVTRSDSRKPPKQRPAPRLSDQRLGTCASRSARERRRLDPVSHHRQLLEPRLQVGADSGDDADLGCGDTRRVRLVADVANGRVDTPDDLLDRVVRVTCSPPVLTG